MPRLATDGEFHGPSIDEFFPEILFNIAGIPVHRIHLVQLVSVIAIVVILVLGTATALVALYKALGGGWDNDRSPTSSR